MGSLRAWAIASRPKTLVAAVLPVAVAWAFALRVSPAPAHTLFLCALVAAIFLQIATNYWNDYFDDIKGGDSAARLGPRRLLQQKLATRAQVARAAALCNGISFLAALPIFMERGWALAALGLICVALSLGYTGGPFPLAYLGLGEFFVLLFFGWVATFFSFYVGTGLWSVEASVLGLQVGCLSMVLITINNLRDYAEDKQSGKQTLVVRGGMCWGRALLAAELAAPYLLNFYWREYPRTAFAYLALPLAIAIFYQMKNLRNPNQQLAWSALHALVFLSLWSWGVHTS